MKDKKMEVSDKMKAKRTEIFNRIKAKRAEFKIKRETLRLKFKSSLSKNDKFKKRLEKLSNEKLESLY